MPIKDDIKSLVERANRLYLSPQINFDNSTDISNEEIFKLYESRFSDEEKERFGKSVKIIHGWIGQLANYRITHESEPKSVEHFENFISSSIEKLVYGIRDAVQESLTSHLEVASPEWMMQMQFDGAKGIKDSPDYEFCAPGKTTGGVVIKQRRQPRALETDLGFTIAILNCAVENIEDETVCEQTLIGASPSDIEVFDGIHEFSRIYSKNPPRLGVIQIDKDSLEIKSDYDLGSRILDHVRQVELGPDKKLSSISFFIITESFNLYKETPAGVKTSISDILSRIPFEKLKQEGINEVVVDFVSCNTYESAAELINNADKIAKQNNMKVAVSFHNGYIFNNITYCHVSSSQYSEFSRTKKTPTNLYDSGDEEMPKKTQLVQIINQGFSIVYAGNIDDLKHFVVDKVVPSRGDTNIRKQLFNPRTIKDIKPGTSWQYTADHSRTLTQIIEDEKRRESPSATFQTTEFREKLQQTHNIGSSFYS